MDSRDRGETLMSFSITPHWSAMPTITTRTRADHADDAARGQGPGVPAGGSLIGLEEGLFPHSRTLLAPDDDRRRAAAVLRRHDARHGHADFVARRYRRRYGTDMPEASVPSRFLEEVPAAVVGRPGRIAAAAYFARAGLSRAGAPCASDYGLNLAGTMPTKTKTRAPPGQHGRVASLSSGDSAAGRSLQLHRQHCRVFRLARQKVYPAEKMPSEEPKGRRGFRPGQKVKHPKYGEGTVYQREGRWGRRQDYGTISSLRFEEAGGAVRAVGEGLELRALIYAAGISERI
jgi:hypothetical protein